MLMSILRTLSITAVLLASLGIALAIGMALAHAGYLGTCQDGTCELVAVIYVMPALGIALYVSALVTLSIVATRRRRQTSG
ncbi:MAG TPA: hypothetical protein VGM35_05150 [Xanthobacteraceae bacterium]